MSEVVSSVIMPHYYAYSSIKAPDKGEVGGSSPPRPTIQITNKYAAILTFPFQGTCHQKTILPKICQKFEWAIDPVIRGVTMRDPHETSKVMLRCHVEGRARQCKTLQGL